MAHNTMDEKRIRFLCFCFFLIFIFDIFAVVRKLRIRSMDGGCDNVTVWAGSASRIIGSGRVGQIHWQAAADDCGSVWWCGTAGK